MSTEVSSNKRSCVDVVTFDQAKLRRELKLLRLHHNSLANELAPDLKKIFQKVIRYMTALHNTPHYLLLEEAIRKAFGDLREGVVGSIGAYFVGCLEDESPGTMCPPKVGHCRPRSRMIVIATYCDGQYRFKKIAPKERELCTLLYINGDHFPGFTRAEREQLREMKCEPFYLIGYRPTSDESSSNKGGTYIKLYPKLLHLTDLPFRFKNETCGVYHRGQLLAGIMAVVVIVAVAIMVIYPTLKK